MSKKAKQMAKEKRRHEKSRRKAASRARYEALKGTAANRKKKGSEGGAVGVRWSRCHADNCGNIGCKRCYPYLQRAF